MCFNLNKVHYLNGLKIQWALNCIFCRVLEEPFGFVNAGGGGEHLSKEKQRSNLSIVILSSRELLCSCWNTTFYYWDYVQEKQNYIFRESFYFFFLIAHAVFWIEQLFFSSQVSFQPWTCCRIWVKQKMEKLKNPRDSISISWSSTSSRIRRAGEKTVCRINIYSVLCFAPRYNY